MTRKWEQALQSIYDAKEKEIPCSEFFDQLAAYVDGEVAGEPVAQRMPELKYHLEHCKVCGEEYETLRDLVRLEAEGRAPSTEELGDAME